MANATPLSTGNHSNTTREELVDILSTFQKVGLAVPYFIIEPVALILNFLILFIVWNREKHAREASNNVPCPQNMLRSQLRTYYFLRHLVLSDLVTCFVAIPMDALEIYRLEFRRSHQYCAASKYVRFVAISTSFYVLVITNFERFWSLTFPFRKLSDRAVVFMIRGVWLVVPVINIPFLFLFHSRIKHMSDNHHYVRVCVAEPGIKGKISLAYSGITLFIPAIAIAAFSGIIIYRVVQIGKAHNTNSPKDENSHADSPKVGIRSVALLSTYITAGFWLCISPAAFYYLIIVGIGPPEFPSSYLISRSVIIIVNASAAVNPVVTILCFQPIRDRAKRYLGLGVKESYSTSEGNNRATTEENNNVQLFSVRVRSSFRKMRYILKGSPAANGNGDSEGAAKTDGSAKVTSGEQTVTEETVISIIERNSNECHSNTIQSTEI